MTRKQFFSLPKFDENLFAKGDKVVVLFGNEPVVPEEQKYFEGHPDPVVLKIDGSYFTYGPRYASQVIRMAVTPRYKVVFDYADATRKTLTWVVVDTQQPPDGMYAIISRFGRDDEAKEFAEEYATFLNDVDTAYKEMVEVGKETLQRQI